MNVDRELHRKILEMAAAAYPDRTSYNPPFHNEKEMVANLLYLQEHGLLDAGLKSLSGSYGSIGFRATAKGIDFLADDGGLTAILGIVTVKFHEDTIKQLLIDRIEASDEPASAKSELVKQVKALPAEGLKTLTTTALRAALTDLPNAMHNLHAWLASLVT